MSDRVSVKGSSVDCLKLPGSLNSSALKDLKDSRSPFVTSSSNVEIGIHEPKNGIQHSGRIQKQVNHSDTYLTRSEHFLNRPENFLVQPENGLNRPENFVNSTSFNELEPTNLQHYAQGLYFVQK